MTRNHSFPHNLALALTTSSFFVLVQKALAQVAWTEEKGCVASVELKDASGQVTTTITDVATIQGVECLIVNVLGTATTFVGLAAFIMLIVGGFLYLTSGGSSKGAEAARQTMTYAIIGIIVALMATFLLRFVAGFTGVTGILNFNLNLGN